MERYGKKTMIYDYLIVGGGIAGSVCARELGKRGKKCIILEKNSSQSEKVCGGGVSYKALGMLEKTGIETESLFLADSKRITGHIIFQDGKYKEKIYKSGKVSLGIRRALLDGCLICAAKYYNAQIKYGEEVKNVFRTGELYEVNGFWAKEIVWASGARSIFGETLNGQSIGLSGQITAKTDLEDNRFHYWYFEKQNSEKYFWAFPVGNHLWNVGVWSRNFERRLKEDYQYCMEKFFLNRTIGEWSYLRKPRAEFLGHCDQRKEDCFRRSGIGDFAGTCNPVNGGGIHYAIKSAVEYAERQQEETFTP